MECSRRKGRVVGLILPSPFPLTRSHSPILIAEISLPHQRGRLLSLQQWMITWGVWFANVLELCPANPNPDPNHVFHLLRNVTYEQQRSFSHSLGDPNDSRNCLHVMSSNDTPFTSMVSHTRSMGRGSDGTRKTTCQGRYSGSSCSGSDN